ncbi:hypothetical protein BC835DRAFT_391527 [Cytidiella melzeri]|nr:hypothetical protein BC835DRAFT_391527 [Cytidiella melzeri]
MSYWNVVGLTGARQLLFTSSNDLKLSYLVLRKNDSTPREVCACISGVKCGHRQPFHSPCKARPSSLRQGLVTCSQCVQDGIDEDDYVHSAIDNERESLSSESSATSDTESNSADYSNEPGSQLHISEEHVTQSVKDQDQPTETQITVKVKLPFTKHAPQQPRLNTRIKIGHIEGPEIHTVLDTTDDVDPPDTTVLRLPGMQSRLEITRVTLVREVPVTPVRSSHKHTPQASIARTYNRISARQSPHANQHRSRAMSDAPFSAFIEMAPPALPLATNTSPRETCESPLAKVPGARPIHDRSSSFTTYNEPQFNYTLEPSAPVISSLRYPCVDGLRGGVTRPVPFATHPQCSPPLQLAGPSKTLLDILNGSSADTPLHDIPASHVLADMGVRCAHDPPVFKPKPIGSISCSRPVRRSSESSTGDVLNSVAASASNIGEQAPPWPPVLAPLSC